MPRFLYIAQATKNIEIASINDCGMPSSSREVSLSGIFFVYLLSLWYTSRPQYPLPGSTSTPKSGERTSNVSISKFACGVAVIDKKQCRFSRAFKFSIALYVELFFPFFTSVFKDASSPSSSIIRTGFSARVGSEKILSAM